MQVELSVGTVLNGRFQIDKVLGVGGFGITYLGHHKDLGYKCAVKEYFISGKCVRQSDGLSIGYQGISEEQFSKYKGRFLDEARTLVKVKNRHVVSVLDVFEANNTAYIVMEFIEGVNLQEKVRQQGPLDYPLAVNYIAQLSEAVECCHQRHILHRDIKPDNVMITPDDRVVLIDFGSARDFVNDEVQRHTAILTQGYAPIEQYTSTSKKGNYTDIYSLGGVFYYAVTGHKPMDATDRMLSEMPSPKSFNPDIPDAAENTIMKAMQMKPEDRYQNVGEFMDDLVGKQQTVEIESAPTSAPAPTTAKKQTEMPKVEEPQKNGKGKVFLWGIIGILVLIGATFLVMNLSQRAEPQEDNITLTAKSSSHIVNMTNNADYEIFSAPEWCEVEAQKGQMQITCLDNLAPKSREGDIVITSKGENFKVKVTQEGNNATYLTVDNSSPQFGYKGDTITLRVSTDGVWRVTNKDELPSWLEMQREDDQIRLKAEENTGKPRSAKVTLRAAKNACVVSVMQGSRDATYLNVSTTQVNIPQSGGTQKITVKTDGEWEISSHSSSCPRFTKKGNIISITAKANDQSKEKTDYIIVTAGSYSKRVNITQNGKNATYLTADPSKLSFQHDGGTKTITIHCDADWNLDMSPTSWAHVQKSGSTITVRVEANTKGTSRSYYFYVQAGKKKKQIEVSQKGQGSSYLDVTPSEVKFSYKGGRENTKEFTVSCDGPWEISSNPPSWAHLTRNGNKLYLWCDKNNGGKRPGSFVIKSGLKTYKVNFKQDF